MSKNNVELNVEQFYLENPTARQECPIGDLDGYLVAWNAILTDPPSGFVDWQLKLSTAQLADVNIAIDEYERKGLVVGSLNTKNVSNLLKDLLEQPSIHIARAWGVSELISDAEEWDGLIPLLDLKLMRCTFLGAIKDLQTLKESKWNTIYSTKKKNK